jgi:hypothetical protein
MSSIPPFMNHESILTFALNWCDIWVHWSLNYWENKFSDNTDVERLVFSGFLINTLVILSTWMYSQEYYKIIHLIVYYKQKCLVNKISVKLYIILFSFISVNLKYCARVKKCFFVWKLKISKLKISYLFVKNEFKSKFQKYFISFRFILFCTQLLCRGEI